METITVKQRLMDGLEIEVAKDNGEVQREHFRGARVGLSWPSSVSPGFYCLIGQLSKNLPNGRYPLRLLKEGSNHIVSNLFQEMLDAMGEFGAYEIFGNVSFKYQSYVLDFYHFYEERRLQGIKLLPSPFFESFNHRVYTIKKWLREESLHVGEATVTREQLRSIKEEDLEKNPEGLFGAINALGYVVSAFDVSDYFPPKGKTSPSRPPHPRAWT